MVCKTRLGGPIGLVLLGLCTPLTGCGAGETATELNPAGPPEIAQVVVRERFNVMVEGTTTQRVDFRLAYGRHPDFEDGEEVVVTGALADGTQNVRVVLDELLVGNHLEEIACADGSFSRVPVGATPDDIARCSGSQAQLEANCTGELAVCIVGGVPVGILDVNPEDGAPDALRFIRDDNGVTPVRIECDGVVMPLNLAQTFYQPSGNQQIPAGTGLNGLGPAVVLKPERGLRTGATCTVAFDSTVVDKDGLQVCAPASPGAGCTPGDLSAVSWGVEPLKINASVPADGQTNVNFNAPARILFLFNARLDADTGGLESLGNFEVTADGVPVTNTHLEWAVATAQNVILVLDDGYLPGTEYTVRVTGTQDQFGGALPDEFAITFRTADAPPLPDAGPDAGGDGGVDGGADAGADAGVDAGVDAGADAGVDAGADAAVDAGPLPDGATPDA